MTRAVDANGIVPDGEQNNPLMRFANDAYVTVRGFTLIGSIGQPGYNPNDEPYGGEMLFQNAAGASNGHLTVQGNTVEHAVNTCVKFQDEQPYETIVGNVLIDCGAGPNGYLNHPIYFTGPYSMVSSNVISGTSGFGIQGRGDEDGAGQRYPEPERINVLAKGQHGECPDGLDRPAHHMHPARTGVGRAFGARIAYQEVEAPLADGLDTQESTAGNRQDDEHQDPAQGLTWRGREDRQADRLRYHEQNAQGMRGQAQQVGRAQQNDASRRGALAQQNRQRVERTPVSKLTIGCTLQPVDSMMPTVPTFWPRTTARGEKPVGVECSHIQTDRCQ